MYCYKITLAYDGTHYSGWQLQPNASSIQGHLEEALQKITRTPVRIPVIGAGRTDAGVHALNQVAHFKITEPLSSQQLLLSFNGLLPKDIRVKKIDEVPSSFHAQYDAKGKEYHYHLLLSRVMDPFRRLYAWHMLRPLDLSLMREALPLFIGTHDFTSFTNEASSGAASRNPIRTLFRLDLHEEGEMVRLEFEGNGFLYKMVRNIVGTLVAIASHRLPVEAVPDLFAKRDRRATARAAPPMGLFLIAVHY